MTWLYSVQLGLMGTTIFYSSGDYGVAGNDNYCLEPNGTQAQGAPIFNPTFPSSCPYITSVGATQVNPDASVCSYFDHNRIHNTLIYFLV